MKCIGHHLSKNSINELEVKKLHRAVIKDLICQNWLYLFYSNYKEIWRLMTQICMPNHKFKKSMTV